MTLSTVEIAIMHHFFHKLYTSNQNQENKLEDEEINLSAANSKNFVA